MFGAEPYSVHVAVGKDDGVDASITFRKPSAEMVASRRPSGERPQRQIWREKRTRTETGALVVRSDKKKSGAFGKAKKHSMMTYVLC